MAKFAIALCTLLVCVGRLFAIDIDWSTVKTMDVIPKDIATRLESVSLVNPVASPNIVGGDEAYPGQFPYQGALFIFTSNGTYFCGCSFLSEIWAITAAHCVGGAISILVIAGAHAVREAETEQQRCEVDSIFIHPGWNADTLDNDITLLKLSTALTYTARVQPVRLPTRSQASNNWAGKIGTVSGWGKTSGSDDTISPVLRYTSSPITTPLACNIPWFFSVKSTQICMSGLEGHSTCNGDSGGPLVITDSNQVILAGVVSYGLSISCSVRWPSVFTRVSSYIDWIAAITGIVIKS